MLKGRPCVSQACEQFHFFLTEKHFCLQTYHKPLLSLLGAQALDLLPLRIWFIMRLMCHTLCTCQVSHFDSRHNHIHLWNHIYWGSMYVTCVVKSLEISPTYIKNLIEQLNAGSVTCTDVWPGPKKVRASYTHSERWCTVERYMVCNTMSDGCKMCQPNCMRDTNGGWQGNRLAGPCGGLGSVSKWITRC